MRRGDFYEAFSEGAKILSRELDFVLTSTKIGKVRVLMSGFPHHTLERFTVELQEKGFQVAVIEADGSVKIQAEPEEWLSPAEAVEKLGLSVSLNTIASYPNRSTQKISAAERFSAIGLEFSIERWRQGKKNYLRVASNCTSPSSASSRVESDPTKESETDTTKRARTRKSKTKSNTTTAIQLELPLFQ